MKKSLFKILLLFSLSLLILCSCNEAENDVKTSPVDFGNTVFAYNLNGIAKYIYDDAGRVVEIITLDPTTLNPFPTNSLSDVCEYSYNSSGILNELTYFGRQFRSVETDVAGRTLRADCTENNDIFVEFLYNSNGIISDEKFYENGVLVLHSIFDNKARPARIEYADYGTLTFDYYDKETYVTALPKDTTDSELSITIYLDDRKLPNYCMQSIDNSVMRTTWTLDESGYCIDTLVESTTEGYSLTEKYEIFYSVDRKVSNVKYYVPESDGSPRLSRDTIYYYDTDGEFISQSEVKYDAEGKIQQKSQYDCSVPSAEKTTIEYYSDGEKEKTEITETSTDSQGRLSATSQYVILPDGTYSNSKKTELLYDDTGNVKERISYIYDEKNTLTASLNEIYSYDSNRRIIKAEYVVLNSNGKLVEREIDEFVYDGNNVKSTTVSMYDNNGELVSKTVTDKEYDASGKETNSTVTVYGPDGNVIESE